MNEWQIVAGALFVGLGPCAWVILRRRFLDGVVALSLAGTLTCVALLALAAAQNRQAFADLAIVCAVVSVAGSLILARYLERVGTTSGREE